LGINSLFFSTFLHCQDIARFPHRLETNFIHHFLHQENTQAANCPVINICIHVRCGYCRRIKRLSMVTDNDSQASGIKFAAAFNIPPVFSLIGMFDDIGTCLINGQLDRIGFGIIHSGIAGSLGGKPPDGVQLVKPGRKYRRSHGNYPTNS
jgi:hypothetical protein